MAAGRRACPLPRPVRRDHRPVGDHQEVGRREVDHPQRLGRRPLAASGRGHPEPWHRNRHPPASTSSSRPADTRIAEAGIYGIHVFGAEIIELYFPRRSVTCCLVSSDIGGGGGGWKPLTPPRCDEPSLSIIPGPHSRIRKNRGTSYRPYVSRSCQMRLVL